MKAYHYMAMLIIMSLLAPFTFSPIFIGTISVQQILLRLVIVILIGGPIYYILGNFLSTFSMMLSALLLNRQPVYVYLTPFLFFYTGIKAHLFFGQTMGFIPSFYLEYKKGLNLNRFYILYYMILFSLLALIYLVATRIFFIPLILPIIPASFVVSFLAGFFVKRYRLLFQLKSEVLTALSEGKKDYEIDIPLYQSIWREKVKMEALPVYGLCYLALIKDMIPESDRKFIETEEEEYYAKISSNFDYYVFADILKINLYLNRENYQEFDRYWTFLEKWVAGQDNMLLVVQQIDDMMEGKGPLSVSLGITEIPILLDMLEKKG